MSDETSTALENVESTDLSTKIKEFVNSRVQIDISRIADSSNILPRVQFMTAKSTKCSSGEFPLNNYALVKNGVFQDIGKEPVCYIAAWRFKAIEIVEGKVLSVSYDENSSEYKRIEAASKGQNTGCMSGAEFLVYIPDISTWASFFMGTKSAKAEVPTMILNIGRFVMLSSRLVPSKKYTPWWAPQVSGCSATFQLPPEGEIFQMITTFTDVENVSNLEVEVESTNVDSRLE